MSASLTRVSGINERRHKREQRKERTMLLNLLLRCVFLLFSLEKNLVLHQLKLYKNNYV